MKTKFKINKAVEIANDLRSGTMKKWIPEYGISAIAMNSMNFIWPLYEIERNRIGANRVV